MGFIGKGSLRRRMAVWITAVLVLGLTGSMSVGESVLGEDRQEVEEKPFLWEQEKAEEQSQKAEEEPDKAPQADLNLDCRSLVLMEKTTGTVLYEKNGDTQLSPASITKIMTLILIFDALDEGRIALTDLVTTSAHAKSMGGSQVFLEEGEQQTVETMIKCIVIASGNDASVAMAEHLSGSESEFVAQMNQRAQGLGMEHTHFEDCCGLTESADHYTSARDVAIMSRELIGRYPQIHQYSSIWMEDITHRTAKGDSTFTLTNTNKLIRQYQWATGLKTGSTSIAKYCVSATASKDGVDLIAVVMGAADHKVRFSQAVSLFQYGYANCRVYRDEDLTLDPVKVTGGVKQEVPCTRGPFSYVSVKGENLDQIEKQILVPDCKAPVKKEQKLGEIRYFLEGTQVGACDILAGEAVRALEFGDCVKLFWEHYLNRMLQREQ